MARRQKTKAQLVLFRSGNLITWLASGAKKLRNLSEGPRLTSTLPCADQLSSTAELPAITPLAQTSATQHLARGLRFNWSRIWLVNDDLREWSTGSREQKAREASALCGNDLKSRQGA